jgi:hypothetical protein
MEPVGSVGWIGVEWTQQIKYQNTLNARVLIFIYSLMERSFIINIIYG